MLDSKTEKKKKRQKSEQNVFQIVGWFQ